MLIIRRSNCINTATGIYTRCCINTIRPPDDEHSVARNMQRIIIINVLRNVIVHQVGHLPRVVLDLIAGMQRRVTFYVESLYRMSLQFVYNSVSQV